MDDRLLAQQDQAMLTLRKQKVSRLMMLLVALLLSALSIALLLADQMLRPDAFVIDQLKLKGRFVHLQAKAVEETVLRHKTGNFFSVNLDEIQYQVEQMRWVDSAEVRREWPNTLTVTVVEHKPVMRMNDNAWVNIRGQVVDLPEYVSQTPVIKLNGEAQHAKSMMIRALQWSKRFSDYGLLLREVTLSKSGAWTLRLRYKDEPAVAAAQELSAGADEFTLLLGYDALDERLARFEQLFDRRFRFSQERLLRADARYPDGIAVKTKSLLGNLNSASSSLVQMHWIESAEKKSVRLFDLLAVNLFARVRGAAST